MGSIFEKKRARHALAWVTAAAVLSLGSGAAAEPSEAARKAARDLGLEGVKLYDEGKYAEAFDRLERAYQVIPAPTIGLWSAQALVKLGRLVEASERYMDVQRMELSANASSAFKRAQRIARREYEELQPRIPHLEIVVEGADPSSLEIRIDDLSVPSSLVGTRHPVDPGTRTITATRGSETVSETVELAEGESKRVVLELPPAPDAETVAATDPAAPPGPPEADRAPGSGQRTLGWIGVGIGGAGLIVGGVTRVVGLGKKSDLEPDCPANDECAPARQDDVDSYNRVRTISNVGLAVGGAALGAGVVLLLTAPSGTDGAEQAQRSFEPWIGLRSAGVRGVF